MDVWDINKTLSRCIDKQPQVVGFGESDFWNRNRFLCTATKPQTSSYMWIWWDLCFSTKSLPKTLSKQFEI